MSKWKFVFLVLAGAVLVQAAARADEALNVGNDAPGSTSYCALDYGIDHGVFQRHGLTITPSSWFGTTKGQPALIGGTIDILLGAGSEMAFIAKGAPELAVAVATGAPANMALVVRRDGPVHTLADLKGRKLGVTTSGGLTDWLAHQVIQREHFPAEAAPTVIAAGTTPTESALLRTGELDGAIMDSVAAHILEANGTGRILTMFGAYVPDFAASVIYARRDVINGRGPVLRAFLAAYFEAQAALLADKGAFVACAVNKTGAQPDIAAKVVSEVSSAFSRDGTFHKAAMDVLNQSFVDTGVLLSKPDVTTLYTEAFLPAH